jgi:uncharacterized lipoprotein YmbA
MKTSEPFASSSASCSRPPSTRGFRPHSRWWLGGGVRISNFGFRASSRPFLLLALAACLGLTGCFGFLKPSPSVARRFVLTPIHATESIPAKTGGLALGVGQVKLPTYLLNSSFAVRLGTNEIDYLPATLWAERLDINLQRVLAANLGALLSTDQVRLSTWRTEEVSVEVYVIVNRLDVDANGRGVLTAWWRILVPGGEKVIKASESRLTHDGPPPQANPAGAVATLSSLVADLSSELAKVIRDTTTSAAPGSK